MSYELSLDFRGRECLIQDGTHYYDGDIVLDQRGRLWQVRRVSKWPHRHTGSRSVPWRMALLESTRSTAKPARPLIRQDLVPTQDPIPADGDYPQHTRLGQVKHLSQAIGEFLEWVMSTYSCELGRPEGPMAGFRPVGRSIQSLLAAHFGVDPVQLEAEKRAMLRELRRLDATRGQ